MNTLAIAIGIPTAAMFLGLILLLVYYYIHNRPPQPGPDEDRDDEREADESKVIVFRWKDITTATENFKTLHGHGIFGKVYYGTWHQTHVAVKELFQNSAQVRQRFLNEMKIIPAAHHENLVNLVGYCHTPKLILVNEFLSGGSLREHLDVSMESTSSTLPWRTRLIIALDASQALEYLHCTCEPRIVHGDVKSKNILLDDMKRGRLGDIAISRINKKAINNMDTLSDGYLDPMYSTTMTIDEKSDVYSFGVVLLEIISGRAPLDLQYPEADRSLVAWALTRFEEGIELDSMLDERIRKDGYNIAAACKVMDIARRCLKYERQERPDMGSVVLGLQEALSMQERDETEFSNVERTVVMNSNLHQLRPR